MTLPHEEARGLGPAEFGEVDCPSLPNVSIWSMGHECVRVADGELSGVWGCSLSGPSVAPSPMGPACREFSFLRLLEEELWLPLKHRPRRTAPTSHSSENSPSAPRLA